MDQLDKTEIPGLSSTILEEAGDSLLKGRPRTPFWTRCRASGKYLQLKLNGRLSDMTIQGVFVVFREQQCRESNVALVMSCRNLANTGR